MTNTPTLVKVILGVPNGHGPQKLRELYADHNWITSMDELRVSSPERPPA